MYKYITDLQILCNIFCKPNKKYIYSNYSIDPNTFEIFFKTHYLNKLTFNSINSEILFIYIFNANKKYILKKYNKTIHDVLKKFFINKKIYYFNKCHKNFNITDYKKMCNAKKIQDELPFIVLMIDELADLMMTTGKDIETFILLP